MGNFRFPVIKVNKVGVKMKRLLYLQPKSQCIRSLNVRTSFKDTYIGGRSIKAERSQHDKRELVLWIGAKVRQFIFADAASRERFIYRVSEIAACPDFKEPGEDAVAVASAAPLPLARGPLSPKADNPSVSPQRVPSYFSSDGNFNFTDSAAEEMRTAVSAAPRPAPDPPSSDSDGDIGPAPNAALRLGLGSGSPPPPPPPPPLSPELTTPPTPPSPPPPPPADFPTSARPKPLHSRSFSTPSPPPPPLAFPPPPTHVRNPTSPIIGVPPSFNLGDLRISTSSLPPPPPPPHPPRPNALSASSAVSLPSLASEAESTQRDSDAEEDEAEFFAGSYFGQRMVRTASDPPPPPAVGDNMFASDNPSVTPAPQHIGMTPPQLIQWMGLPVSDECGIPTPDPISIFFGSWNVGSTMFLADNIASFIPTNKYDMYVIGLQECKKSNQWIHELKCHM